MSDSSRRTTAGSVLRRCWPIVAAVPLGAVCGGVYALAAPAQYQANAYVMAVPVTVGDSATAVNFAQAYGRVITQPEILLSASATTGVPVAKLGPLVQAVTSPDAPMIQITGTAATASRSAAEANAVADSLVAFGNAASKQTDVKLLTFAKAARPAAPSSPSRTLDVAVGGAAGLLIGGLAMLARQSRTADAEAAPGALPTPRTDLPEPSEPAPAPAAATGDAAGPARESRARESAAQGRR